MTTDFRALHTQAALSVKAQHMQRVERGVLPHMLMLMCERAGRSGFELRDDFMRAISLATISVMADLDDLSISRTAKAIDDNARMLLHDLSPDNAVQGLITVAYFALRLTDTGLWTDPGNNAVLQSIALVEDAKQGGEAWAGINLMKAAQDADNLLTRSRLLGLFDR